MGEDGRSVSLVLVDGAGAPIGVLPDFDVPVPYWQEVADVIAGARQRGDVGATVLRLLGTDRPEPHGGRVTYVAELSRGGRGSPHHEAEPLALDPVPGQIAALMAQDHPLRQAYARPGGPAATERWALAELPPGLRVAASQQRTWNLSAIWRLDEPSGRTTHWVKQVPPFFAHEASVLRWANVTVPGAVPALVAADTEGRMLLEHIEGDDLYDAPLPARLAILEVAHRIQRAAIADADALAASGVPDRRGVRMAAWIGDQLGEHVAAHPATARLRVVLDELPSALAALDRCGLPATLVHGDEHPGNAVGRDGEVAILDWGDSFVGNPAFDALRLGIGLPTGDQAALLRAWCELWSSTAPGCRPYDAVALVRPIEALRLAAVYAAFLVQIEPSERAYHRADLGRCLDEALAASGTSV